MVATIGVEPLLLANAPPTVNRRFLHLNRGDTAALPRRDTMPTEDWPYLNFFGRDHPPPCEKVGTDTRQTQVLNRGAEMPAEEPVTGHRVLRADAAENSRSDEEGDFVHKACLKKRCEHLRASFHKEANDAETPKGSEEVAGIGAPRRGRNSQDASAGDLESADACLGGAASDSENCSAARGDKHPRFRGGARH